MAEWSARLARLRGWLLFALPGIALYLYESGMLSIGRPAGIATSAWQPERLYEDKQTITVPCEHQPGDSPLFVGMADSANREERVYLTAPAQRPAL